MLKKNKPSCELFLKLVYYIIDDYLKRIKEIETVVASIFII